MSRSRPLRAVTSLAKTLSTPRSLTSVGGATRTAVSFDLRVAILFIARTRRLLAAPQAADAVSQQRKLRAAGGSSSSQDSAFWLSPFASHPSQGRARRPAFNALYHEHYRPRYSGSNRQVMREHAEYKCPLFAALQQ